MAKMKVEFSGFNEVLARLKSLEGDVKSATEKALTETHGIVTKKVEEASQPHKRTGRMEQSLQRQANVKWQGTVARVEVGFDIKQGGLPSIFLMYGTPKQRKDQKLYNAFYGRPTRVEVMQAQEDAFYEAIRRSGG